MASVTASVEAKARFPGRHRASVWLRIAGMVAAVPGFILFATSGESNTRLAIGLSLFALGFGLNAVGAIILYVIRWKAAELLRRKRGA